MNDLYLGVYWQGRPLSMRGYADLTRGFLKMLVQTHPAFSTLYWVGNKPSSAVLLHAHLENLDRLIYCHAGDEEKMLEAGSDGYPAIWDGTSAMGFGMTYNTGKPSTAGGISISIDAGQSTTRLMNSATISFPCIDDTRFSDPDMLTYPFLHALFQKLILYWQPEFGRISSYEFSKALGGRLPKVGWLTYVDSLRAAKLQRDVLSAALLLEQLPGGGIIFSLGEQITWPSNLQEVETARQLRNKLATDGVLS